MAGYPSRLLAAIPRPWTPATFGYVLRSMAAAGLALWLGFQLHLDSPFSAASTVLLLVHPLQGAVLDKGFHRVLGTLVGIVAAFVLTGLFAQQMLLYILGIGLWLGLCVAAMTVLRHYQATAAVVAGYTVCLALGPALVAPEKAFEHIVTRGTAVGVGVFSLSLIAILFSRKTLEQKVRHALSDVCARSARLLAARFSEEQPLALAADQRQLAIDIGKVDDLLGVARGESSLIRSRLPTLQAGLAHLQSAIMDVAIDERPQIRPALCHIAVALRCLGEDLANARCGLTAAAQRIAQMDIGHASANPRALLLMARREERLADLADALTLFSSLEHKVRVPLRKVGFHRHYPDAVRNAIRALLAILAAGGVWYLTGWDQGPALLAVMGPCCTLLAIAPAPARGVASFIRGTLYAVLATTACKFLLMPLINGFPLLLLTLALFWSFGIHATTQPRHALQGASYLIAFNTLVSTGGTAEYDFIEFANQALAWIVAMAICLLAFQILAKDAGRHVLELKEALRKETRQLLRHGQRIDHSKWQAKQQHRIVALKNLLGPDNRQDYQAGYLSLQLSRELKRIQRLVNLLAPASAIASCAQTGMRRIARYADAPAIGAVMARRTARSMVRLGAQHLAACYEDLAWLLERYVNAAPDSLPTTHDGRHKCSHGRARITVPPTEAT